MTDDLKSSARAWGGDEHDNSPERDPSPPHPPTSSSHPPPTTTIPTDAPPSYTPSASTHHHHRRRSNPPPSSPPLNPLHHLSTLSHLPFHQHHLPTSTLSPDLTTVTTTHAPYHTNPTHLLTLLHQQSLLPPHPHLLITGTHADPHGSATVDFHLLLSLLPLIDLTTSPHPHPTHLHITTPPPTTTSPYPGARRNKTTPPEPSPLEQWTRHFTSLPPSEPRSFTLTRTIPALTPLQPILEGHVRTLIASLSYRGKVDVTFPIHHEKVIISKKAGGNWLTGLLKLYQEKRFEVVESVWAVKGESSLSVAGGEGDVAVGHEQGAAAASGGRRDRDGGGDGGRSQVDAWWAQWQGPVRNVVLGKQKGKVGVEDWIEWQMGRRGEERRGEWGVDWREW